MYTIEYLKDFATQVFQKIGCTKEDATTIANVLTAAESRGIPSHGMIRIKDYYQLWEKGRINVKPNIKIEHETPSTAVVNGDSSFGMVAAKKSMEIAIEKAKNVGTGWVSTKNSNHFGIAGFYSMMALEQDMVGIAMTNANSLVAPTFSKSKLLGTNPIAVGVPTGKYPPFIADFATSPIARGKLAIMGKKGEIAPSGFVQDKNGRPSTDPDIITRGGAILPLGGDYTHGSHKGYCMSAIVDIFSAVFSGANFGPFVPPQVAYLPPKEESVGEGLGHFFGAMRIDAFQKADDFKAQMDKWIETFKNAKSTDGQPKVLIPGEPERAMEKKTSKEGVNILPAVKDDLVKIADELDIEFK
ncbi:MAG: Ldh family oxidoreductase [Bacteroidales bacterium]|jgi:L-2-hydroxycarboxylate dehydrogenase (NAD+)|nr:Ldh family oxidoreductase [Bacteroidales bacterium]